MIEPLKATSHLQLQLKSFKRPFIFSLHFILFILLEWGHNSWKYQQDPYDKRNKKKNHCFFFEIMCIKRQPLYQAFDERDHPKRVWSIWNWKHHIKQGPQNVNNQSCKTISKFSIEF